jgi:hypothetical protein
MVMKYCYIEKTKTWLPKTKLFSKLYSVKEYVCCTRKEYQKSIRKGISPHYLDPNYAPDTLVVSPQMYRDLKKLYKNA